jgi:hypothetical protein
LSVSHRLSIDRSNRRSTVAIVHEEFQGLRITPNVYTTLGELDRFCEQMELIARKGLPA